MPAMTTAVVAVVALGGCATADKHTQLSKPATSPSPALPAEATIATIQLDITGTGVGDITYSVGGGQEVTARDVVLQNWRYLYEDSPTANIVLSVDQWFGGTSSCAVHVDGQLVATDDGHNSACSRTAT